MSIKVTEHNLRLLYDVIREYILTNIDPGDHKTMYTALTVFGRAVISVDRTWIEVNIKSRFLIEDKAVEIMKNNYDENIEHLYEFTRYPNGVRHGPCIVSVDDADIGLYTYADYNYINGVIEGNYTTYYTNGNERLVGQYIKGKKEGEFIEYGKDNNEFIDIDSDQLVYRRLNYVDDLLDGIVTKYHNNGNLYKIIHYRNNIRHGVCKEYSKDGKYRSICNYRNGKLSGKQIHYKDNIMVGRTMWKNGLINGLKEEFFDDGSICLKVDYVNNDRQGLEYVYYKNGQINTISNYHQDALYGKKYVYNDLGQLISMTIYRNHRLNGLLVEYSNTQIMRVSIYDDDILVDQILEYNKDGTLKLCIPIINGKPYGQAIYYNYIKGTREYIDV